MEILQSVISELFAFKAWVLLPVIFLVIALLSRMSAGKAFVNAVKLGVGFAGIFLIFDAFLSLLRPAILAIVTSRGLDFPVVDAGWPPLAAITWSSWIAPVSILLVFALNFALLLVKRTTVLYIDIWNYWHFALIGSMLLAVGASPLVALSGTAFAAVLVIKTTEWTAPFVVRETGLKGIAVSPLTVSGFLPWAVLVDWIFDRIPVLNRINWDPSRQKGKLAAAGDPLFVGLALGIFLGILAGYPFRETASFAVQIAAVMFLLPKCGGLIAEGTGAISAALQQRLSRLLGGRELVIAMDTGFLMTNSSVVVTGLLMMPLSLLVAFILPWNRVLPAGDLPNLISVCSVIVLVCRGNVFRSLCAGLPLIALFLTASTFLAPLITRLAEASGALSASANGSLVSSFTDGGNPLRWWIFELFRGNLLAVVFLVPMCALLFLTARKSKKVAASLREEGEAR